MLNIFFASVFTIEGEGDIPQFERRAYSTELVDLSITRRPTRGDPGITGYLTIYGLSCLQFAY